MCTACSTASQHFNDGSQPVQRTLQTSVQQGTSPDWKSVHYGGSEQPDIPRFGADENSS